MERLHNLATLFLRIAATLEGDPEAGDESLMLAPDAAAYRRMAEIIQEEIEPEKSDGDITLN